MLPALGAFAPFLNTVFKTIEKSIPDKDLQEKLKADLNMQLLTSGTEELKASARIVEAEAKAGWFASSWRPLLMYILIGILVLNYIISPIILALFSKKIGIELPSDVWTCLNIGLGGYVTGRSAEAVARTLASRPKSNNQENG